MAFSLWDYVLWVAGASVSGFCLILGLRHRVLSHVPSFPLYLLVVFANHGFTWWLFEVHGYYSKTTWYTYWAIQGMLLALRGVVIGELAWRILRPYRGVWALARLLLLLVAVVLVILAVAGAWAQSPWIGPLVYTAKRGLELAAVVVILALLAVCRYYGVQLARHHLLLLLGLGLYSAVEVANFSLLARWMEAYKVWWDGITKVSYLAALLLWCAALWRPLPAEEPRAELVGGEVYDRLAPQMSHRMRELNERLLEMLKG